MLKPRFNRSDIHKALLGVSKKIEQVMIRQLIVLGERCVNEARTLDTYRDQTGNLRSSIGYAIYVNGRDVHSNFESYGQGTEGKQNAKNLASKAASKGTNVISIIVVAGMEYSHYVEAKGFPVLSTAEDLAERQFPVIMKNLTDKIKQAI